MGFAAHQLPVVLITAASLVMALAVMVYALMCWRQRNMMYFACMAIAISINVLGYYLEVTAGSLEAALVACKVAYTGVPLTGLLLFLFSLDYSDRIRLHGVLRIILFSLAPVFTLAVFLYPSVPLFYESLSFSTEGLVPHLIVEPGPLYYPCIIYVSLFSILASINLVVGFFREKRYEGVVIFLIAIGLPLFTQFFTMLLGLLDGWNPQRTSLAISLVLLAIYLARYKQAEWQSMGRELVVQEMEDAFILLNSKGFITDHNLSAEAYFPALKKRTPRIKLEDVWELPAEYLHNYGTQAIDLEQDGRTINLKIKTSALEAKGKVTGTLVIITDDTSNNQLMQELTRMARLDELTGLNNRATFFHDGSLSFDLARRNREEKGCALMIDLDFFKNVNDTYGHAVGDEVLRFMGELLINRFRRTDICGRYGGEELSVWMPATSLEGALQVAEELRSLTEAKIFKAGDMSFNVTISIGISSMHNAEAADFEDLIKKADFALYEAKHTGRNRVCVYKHAIQEKELS